MPEAGIEPAHLSVRNFLPTSAFAAVLQFAGGARLHHSLAAAGARRLLSTPSQAGLGLGLGSALARIPKHPGLSPSLTGFTSDVSLRRLKLFKSPVSTDFTTCSGLLIPDTDLGENLAVREVSDEQAATYVFH